jgi:hypothetical protein
MSSCEKFEYIKRFTCNVAAEMKNKEHCRRRLPMDANDGSGGKMKISKSRKVWY